MHYAKERRKSLYRYLFFEILNLIRARKKINKKKKFDHRKNKAKTKIVTVRLETKKKKEKYLKYAISTFSFGVMNFWKT